MTAPRILQFPSGEAVTSSHLAPIATHSPPPPRWRSALASFESGVDLSGTPPHSAPLATPPTRRRALLRLRPWSFTLPIAGAFLGAFWGSLVATLIGFGWGLIVPVALGAIYGHLAQESVG